MSAISLVQPSFIAKFSEHKSILSFKAGQTIPLEENGREAFIYLCQGQVKICLKKEDILRTVNICGEGEMVGFENSGFNSTYQITAISDCTIYRFDRENFMDSTDKTEHMNREVFQIFLKSMSTKDERIFALENRSAKSRVAAMLMGLFRKFGESNSGGNKIAIDLDRKTMAEISGTVIETLSRTLTDLEEKNIILRKRRSIYIVDFNALDALAIRGE